MEKLILVNQAILENIRKELTEIKQLLGNRRSSTEDWIDEAEAQSLLAIKTTTLWKLRSANLIKSSKVGRKTFYSLASINAYLKSNSK